MKRLFFSFILAVMTFAVMAQINFRTLTWEETLAAAKAEDKLVFVDCYTSWCGPCKLLAKNVFTQEKVGDCFNPRLVSVKIDMEKGEGISLRKKYDVNAFPTLLILNADGDVLWRHCGYIEADDLIAQVEKGLKANPLNELKKRYEAGERNAGFISEYLERLDMESMTTTLRAVMNDFLKGKTDAVFTDTAVYKIFARYATVPENETFREVYARKGEYARKYGEKVALQLERTWEEYGRRFLKREAKKTVGYNREGLEAYYRLMKQCRVPEAEAIRAKYLLKGGVATQEWTILLQELPVYTTFSRVEEWDVYLACGALCENVQDAGARKKLAAFLRKRGEALKDVEDTSGRTMTMGEETMPLLEYFRRSYKKMLQELED